ncbi:MAG: DNA-3-methyladenine glycosylase [Candidatus Zixiibacteriota bacterium]|nr:MAG: DNA-3-methyladenine glycosylase [candidate division Zixibacteria bacterium]
MGGFRKLRRSFYARPTLQVARDIIGKFIVYRSPQGKLSARIVEVEAYIGRGDPACHAARGKTERNEVMFGKAGVTYIYFIYGMYHCLNFVTEPAGRPAALLLRAAEPAEGTGLMKKGGSRQGLDRLLSGPGKFCRAFGLTRAHNGLDLTGDKIYLEDRNKPAGEIVTTTRIGINHGRQHRWRFYDAGSAAVSRK